MHDSRANMEGNRLLDLGAPRVDWTRTPGRTPGFWLAVVAVILAVAFPFAALVVAVIGFSFARKAYRVIPAGARGRGLVMAAIALAGVAMLLVVIRAAVPLLN